MSVKGDKRIYTWLNYSILGVSTDAPIFFRDKIISYYDCERRIVMEILIGFIIGVVLTIRGDMDKLISKIGKMVKDFLGKS